MIGHLLRKQAGTYLLNLCQQLLDISRWLYTSFFAIDANFRLKRRIVSKDSVDPSLSNGWSYFVNETAYRSYLNDHGMETQEVRIQFLTYIAAHVNGT
jgi:hypothetical protein